MLQIHVLSIQKITYVEHVNVTIANICSKRRNELKIHSDPVMASFKEFAEDKLYDLARMYGAVDPLTGETIVWHQENCQTNYLSEIKLNIEKKLLDRTISNGTASITKRDFQHFVIEQDITIMKSCTKSSIFLSRWKYNATMRLRQNSISLDYINIRGKNYCVECVKALILLLQQGLKP